MVALEGELNDDLNATDFEPFYFAVLDVVERRSIQSGLQANYGELGIRNMASMLMKIPKSRAQIRKDTDRDNILDPYVYLACSWIVTYELLLFTYTIDTQLSMPQPSSQFKFPISIPDPLSTRP